MARDAVDPRTGPWPRWRRAADGAVAGADARPWPSPPVTGAHLAVLWAFAVVQPLFDDLSRNAEFFVARQNTSSDIVILALALTFVPPLLLTLAVLLAGLLWRPLGRGLHLALVGVLAAAIAIGVLKRVEPTESAFLLPAAAAAGAGAAVAYVRWATARRFLTALIPAPVVFVVIFMLFSPVSELVLNREAAAAGSAAQSATPVVLVVFDELPAISLMDRDREVDAASFPAFGRLAATSTWYRNATTVADGTFMAVPGILAGKLPAEQLPTSRQYPRSVFTLLESSHDIHALEPITHVCPSRLCTRPPAAPASERLRALVSDLSIVEGHLLLPADLAEDLPPIDRDYEDFGGGESGVLSPSGGRVSARGAARGDPPIAGGDVFARRLRDADRFIGEIGPQRARPPLVMAHLEVPHVPWRLLPSGHQYPVARPSLPGLTDQTWTRDRFLVEQAMQRHLLQVGYADRVLGRMTKRLQDTGLWDRALVVVTADHGVGLRPGGSRRPVTTADFAGIAGVPLFVKLPQQRTAAVDDAPARTIDVLPTIASVLGVPGGAGDGVALNATPPTVAPAVRNGRRGRYVSIGSLDAFVRARDAELARQRRIFPRGLRSALSGRRDRALIGRRVATLRVRTSAGRARIDAPGAFARVRRRSGVVPVYVSGELTNAGRVGQRLAVAVNGRIRATGRSWAHDGRKRFSMVVAPADLRNGRNRIEVLAVEGRGRVARLPVIGS